MGKIATSTYYCVAFAKNCVASCSATIHQINKLFPGSMSRGVCWVTVNGVIPSDLMCSAACGSQVRSLTASDCARLRRDENYHNIHVHQQSVFE